MVKVCQVCGKEFNVKLSNSNRGWGKYCSLACRYLGQRVEPEKRQCLRCGKEFWIGGSTGKWFATGELTGRKRKGQLFCSRACRSAGVNKPREMTEVEKAWFAGVFDGEGSIVDYKHIKGYSRVTGERFRGLRISITNTVKELEDKVLEVAGVGTIQARPKPINPRHSQAWHWQVHGENAKSILRQILPWLIVKRAKALKVLEQT